MADEVGVQGSCSISAKQSPTPPPSDPFHSRPWQHEWQAFALHRTLAEVVTALSPAAQGQLQHFMMGMYVPASSGFGIAQGGTPTCSDAPSH